MGTRTHRLWVICKASIAHGCAKLSRTANRVGTRAGGRAAERARLTNVLAFIGTAMGAIEVLGRLLFLTTKVVSSSG